MRGPAFSVTHGAFRLCRCYSYSAPSNDSLSVLRSLRVLRVLRLVSAVPRLRRIVSALLLAVPGVGAIVALLLLVFYVFAVITTKLFGAAFPDWFGTIGDSMFTLFQVMTLESWSMGIVRPVMEGYSWAWIVFVAFIVCQFHSTICLSQLLSILCRPFTILKNRNRLGRERPVQNEHLDRAAEFEELKHEMRRSKSFEGTAALISRQIAGTKPSGKPNIVITRWCGWHA